jgi:transposase
MFEHYLGVDLHKRRTYLVLMDAQGQVTDQRRLTNEAVAAYAAQLPPNTFAVLESTGNWSFMYDVLSCQVEHVALAHPKRVRTIAAAKVKTDKLDATMLAHLARTDLLPTAYAPPIAIRHLRDWVRHRAKLVRERTRHKNQIHRLLSLYNLDPPCTDLFGKRGQAFLQEARTQIAVVHQQLLDDHCAMIEALDVRIQATNRAIHAWAQQDARVGLLMTMPGIGEYSAAVIIAEIGEMSRFPNAKHLCSYAGLVPSVRNSDSKIRHGHITKEGTPWLRWIMVSAAQRAPAASTRLATFFERVAQQQGRKTARIALARKMLSIVYAMLRHAEPFRELSQPG